MRNIEDHRMSGAGVPSDEEGRMSGAGVPSYVAISSILDEEKDRREKNARAITRAKFTCKGIELADNVYTIHLDPTDAGNEENRKFFVSHNPAGGIWLAVKSSSTAEQFKVGYDYFVDFTEVEKAK